MRVHSLYGRMALMIALSPNALERAQAQRRLATESAGSGNPTPAEKRKDLVTRLKALDEPSVVALVESKGLPATTTKWTLEQLEDVVTTLENPAAAEEAGEATEARVFTLAFIADGSSIVVGPGMTNEEWDAYEPPAEHEAVMVSAPEELAEVPNDVLLAVVNQAKGTKVKKFANPDAARDQAFESLGIILEKQNTTAEAGEAKAAKAAKAPKAPKEPKAPATPKLIDRKPKAKDQIKPVGEGTKIALLIDLLNQEDGTTIEEIEEKLSATGKPVKAAAWLGYDLNSVTGYGVRQDAETKRLYLVLPAGMKEVLPYKEKKAPTPPAPKAAPAAEAPAATPAKAAAPAKKGAPAAPAAAPVVPAKPAPKAAPAAKTAAAAPAAKTAGGPSFAEKMAAAKAAKAAAAAPAPVAKKAPAPAKKK